MQHVDSPPPSQRETLSHIRNLSLSAPAAEHLERESSRCVDHGAGTEKWKLRVAAGVTGRKCTGIIKG